jgi:ribosome-associated toxin RatA of RatAB toxin-antitoxin module
MTRVDEQLARAPASLCYRIAADVERWPEILPHYRWVRFHARGEHGEGRVEMAAWRIFPAALRFPTWWVSEMRTIAEEPAIEYRHVEGITRGMAVRWEFRSAGRHTRLRVLHAWNGPSWPLVGPAAWRYLIGPHFVSAIARRTLAGVAAEAERAAAALRSPTPRTR